MHRNCASALRAQKVSLISTPKLRLGSSRYTRDLRGSDGGVMALQRTLVTHQIYKELGFHSVPYIFCYSSTERFPRGLKDILQVKA